MAPWPRPRDSDNGDGRRDGDGDGRRDGDTTLTTAIDGATATRRRWKARRRRDGDGRHNGDGRRNGNGRGVGGGDWGKLGRYHRGSGVNHFAINLTLFLCAYYNADMLPTYLYATCRLDIVSTSADTAFGRVANMSADMSAICRADTHVSVDSTIFSTFENPTFPAKC